MQFDPNSPWLPCSPLPQPSTPAQYYAFATMIEAKSEEHTDAAAMDGSGGHSPRLRQFRCTYPSCPSTRTNKRNNIERHVWTQHIRVDLNMPEARYFARYYKHHVEKYVTEVTDGRIRQRGRRAHAHRNSSASMATTVTSTADARGARTTSESHDSDQSSDAGDLSDDASSVSASRPHSPLSDLQQHGGASAQQQARPHYPGPHHHHHYPHRRADTPGTEGSSTTTPAPFHDPETESATEVGTPQSSVASAASPTMGFRSQQPYNPAAMPYSGSRHERHHQPPHNPYGRRPYMPPYPTYAAPYNSVRGPGAPPCVMYGGAGPMYHPPYQHLNAAQRALREEPHKSMVAAARSLASSGSAANAAAVPSVSGPSQGGEPVRKQQQQQRPQQQQQVTKTITLYGEAFPLPPVGSSLIPIERPALETPEPTPTPPVPSAPKDQDLQRPPSAIMARYGPLAPLLLALQTIDAAEGQQQQDGEGEPMSVSSPPAAPCESSSIDSIASGRDSPDNAKHRHLSRMQPPASAAGLADDHGVWRPWAQAAAAASR